MILIQDPGVFIKYENILHVLSLINKNTSVKIVCVSFYVRISLLFETIQQRFSSISKIFTGLWGNVYFSYLSVYLQKNQGLILKKIETYARNRKVSRSKITQLEKI